MPIPPTPQSIDCSVTGDRADADAQQKLQLFARTLISDVTRHSMTGTLRASTRCQHNHRVLSRVCITDGPYFKFLVLSGFRAARLRGFRV